MILQKMNLFLIEDQGFEYKEDWGKNALIM